MGRSPEVMRLIEGRLFDAESYERTELLRGSFAGESGYYVVVWSSTTVDCPDEFLPKLVGPFKSVDLASNKANDLR
jgi:hypothetical protein